MVRWLGWNAVAKGAAARSCAVATAACCEWKRASGMGRVGRSGRWRELKRGEGEVGPAGAPPGGRRRRTVATRWPSPERGRDRPACGAGPERRRRPSKKGNEDLIFFSKEISNSSFFQISF